MAFINENTGNIVKRIFENGVQDNDRITLVSGKDNHRIPIHRVILAAASKYYAAAMGPNFQEGNQTEFIFDGIDGKMLKAIVDFCYSGRIEMTEENVTEHLAIASSRELDLLVKECWSLIEEKFTAENAVETWLIADKYSNLDVCQRALNLVCESFGDFPIENIQTFDHRLMAAILESESVGTTEDLLFERLMDWFRFNEDEREQYMVAFLAQIRLELISAQVLKDNQFEATYKRFDCFELVIAEYKKRCSSLDCSADIFRRRRSIYCVSTQCKGIHDAEQSAVKIERFDRASNEFKEVGEIKVGDLAHFNVQLHGNKVFILGGLSNKVPLNSVTMFDLNTKKLKVLPEMNIARAGFSSIVLGQHIYVFGGMSLDGNAVGILNSCERFDLASKTWTNLRPMNFARCGGSAAVLNGYIYVAGGYKKGQTAHVLTADVELYDPVNDDWLQVAPMNEPRVKFALFKSKMFLYAIGCTSTVERCDVQRSRWTKMLSFNENADVRSSVGTPEGIFVVKKSGGFGRIDLDTEGVCSFQSLSKSKSQKSISSRFLLQN